LKDLRVITLAWYEILKSWRPSQFIKGSKYKFYYQ
jgi:hypothetical protein